LFTEENLCRKIFLILLGDVNGNINVYFAEIFDHKWSHLIPGEFAESCPKLRKGNTGDL
jgi:hypothetical protein